MIGGPPAARSSPAPPAAPPLVAHVIYHLIMGGLENGLVNLVNRIAPGRYRHAIICMAYDSEFRSRIERPDVEVFALRVHERGLHRVTPSLVRLFRRLRPSIVHSRNLSGLDSLIPAMLAGVPWRIHGEHGWETDDLQGLNRKNRWNRRLHTPLVNRYVALSRHQERYLIEQVGVEPRRITQIYNGVDIERFHPRDSAEPSRAGGAGAFVIGTVGRMQAVKDPLNLVEAFLHLRRSRPDLAPRVRLAMVGDGALREAVEARLREAGAWEGASLPGAREDVAEQLRAFDLFALPSKAEGISNTILEAMATGLPVVATRVGGNPELVEEGRTGCLVPLSDPAALAAALARYAENPRLAAEHGAAGRARACEDFSLERMVARYTALYDEGARRGQAPPVDVPTTHPYR
jgi:sugar transferase (PEP-CTERM/EpsH1 system associated)